MPRPIDHLVLAVPDLAAAVERYGAMGFIVGSRNVHPWGTENAVVQLDGSYLELIGLADGFRPPPPDHPAAPFATPVAEAVARGGGLAAVALNTADADAARFRSAGVGQGRRLDFERRARAADGAPRVLRFSLAFAALEGLPEAGFFTCRHHGAFGDPASRRHPNGATRLHAAVLATDEPLPLAISLSALLDAPSDGTAGRRSFDTPTGRLSLMTPAEAEARYGAGTVPERFVAFAIAVDALAPVRARLDGVPLACAEIAGALVVPPDHAFGTALAFVPAPCHSRRPSAETAE